MHLIKNSLLIIFISCQTFSQNTLPTLGESTFGITHKISKKITSSFSIRSRYFLSTYAKAKFKQQQLDAYHFSTLALSNNKKASLGIYYRNRVFFNTGSNELRLMQQWRYSKPLTRVRLRHRFRAEQRMLDSETIFRQRYRFAIDFPLKGRRLSIGEPYMFNSVEGLWSLNQGSKPEIDSRTTTQIGWQLSEVLKIQTGLEYRLEAFNTVAKNYIFLLTSAILRI
ncbi:DUF2490 domain-containing protein [Mariniflexile ostreae]|uniref:DUF2490 domain-containing protein n=1 Tax=Mariniflexile ostreae TaxID=1520892 RepID=A0ABV5F7J6_9FLAO